jgi:hypothetical protein
MPKERKDPKANGGYFPSPSELRSCRGVQCACVKGSDGLKAFKALALEFDSVRRDVCASLAEAGLEFRFNLPLD